MFAVEVSVYCHDVDIISIRETLNLSMCADSSTDTTDSFGSVLNFWHFFFTSLGTCWTFGHFLHLFFEFFLPLFGFLAPFETFCLFY